MSNRRRPRRPAGSRRAPAAGAVAVADPLDDLIEQLQICRAGACLWPAFRWYTRADLQESRLLVVPVCPEHFDQADREVCPAGHMEGGCLASGDDPHFTDSPEVIVDTIGWALVERRWGIALPERVDWQRLDVLRPGSR